MHRYLGFLLVFVAAWAHAYPVDQGFYSTDPLTNLQWLDLSKTRGMTYDEAAQQWPNWRHATNEEVEQLFDTIFQFYNPTDRTLDIARSDEGAFLHQSNNVNTFLTLFGRSDSVPNSSASSQGLYMDEGGIIRMTGIFAGPVGLTIVYGLDYNEIFDRTTTDAFGVFMVRQAFPDPPVFRGRLPKTPGGTDYRAYYDENLDITWTQQANYRGSLPGACGFPPHPPCDDGIHDWDNHQAWVQTLKIGGVGGWRLATMDRNNDGIVAYCRPQNELPSGKLSANEEECKDNELGYHAYYNGVSTPLPDPFSSGGTFTIVVGTYFSGTETSCTSDSPPDCVPSPSYAWAASFDGRNGLGGEQSTQDKSSLLPAWAVHEGDAAFALQNADLDSKDVTSLADISGDGLADFAYLDPRDPDNTVEIFSTGASGPIQSIDFRNENWVVLAVSTVNDGNGDGVSNDPAISVVASRKSTNRHVVDTRLAATGVQLGAPIAFLDPASQAVDVAVVNDTDGDGVENDPSIAVLFVRPGARTGRVEVRRLSDGSLVGSYDFFEEKAWLPVAIEATTEGGVARISVLGVNQSNGTNRVETRRVSDGIEEAQIGFLGANWEGRDLAVLTDSDGNGVADDPALLVLGTHRTTDQSRVQAKLLSTGAVLKNISIANGNWDAVGLATSTDIDGNMIEEVAAVTVKRDNGNVVIKLRDYSTELVIGNIVP